MAGRPTDYSLELAAHICERLADGESLKSICTAEEMPCKASVYLWLTKYPEFSDMYARAREDQADTLADELLDIADDARNDWMTRQLADGDTERVIDSEHINRSRLRIDTRKWIASKLKPKKYGDKIETQHTGANGGPIVITNTDAEL